MNAQTAVTIAAAAFTVPLAIVAYLAGLALVGVIEAWPPRRRPRAAHAAPRRSLGGQIWAAGRARVPALLHDDDTAAWPREDWRGQ